jgi:hypothetical protein
MKTWVLRGAVFDALPGMVVTSGATTHSQALLVFAHKSERKMSRSALFMPLHLASWEQ